MLLKQINSPYDLKELNINQLNAYANELREYITQIVGKNGGHLASNLGVIELTIALHYVFDSPNDKILFDVGHQSYAHKIITGRRDLFKNLRQDDMDDTAGTSNAVPNTVNSKASGHLDIHKSNDFFSKKGLSGFPSPAESDCDLFCTGHSSTSLSLAIGLARARDLSNQRYHILPVIGDGSFTGGMIYEALNDLGQNKTNITIILNDNKMSISQNISAISKYFTKLRLSRKYSKLKSNIKKAFIPFVSTKNSKAFKQATVRIKQLFLANRLFENFGIAYYGPIDGHDIAKLVEVFYKVAAKNQPSIIHLVTTKGKGYLDAENSPEKFHGISPTADKQNEDGKSYDALYEITTPIDTEFKVRVVNHSNAANHTDIAIFDILAKNKHSSCADNAANHSIKDNFDWLSERSFSKIAGDTLTDLAQQDEKVVAITAAMQLGTGLDGFAKRIKDRYFDVSIAEQHAVSVAAGLAKGGYKPYFFVYSTFLQRGFDQILHEVSLNNLAVRFMIDRAGVVGSDGATHQGVFDVSYLSMIPNMTIVTPKDGNELKDILIWSLNFNSPLAIRYPKDYHQDFKINQSGICLGKWEQIYSCYSSVYLLAAGSRMIQLSMSVLNQKKDINIINARFIKPLDTAFLNQINKRGNLIITLEDNVRSGGFGQSVLWYINNQMHTMGDFNAKGATVISFCHNDFHIPFRNLNNSFKASNITTQAIIDKIECFLNNKNM